MGARLTADRLPSGIGRPAAMTIKWQLNDAQP